MRTLGNLGSDLCSTYLIVCEVKHVFSLLICLCFFPSEAEVRSKRGNKYTLWVLKMILLFCLFSYVMKMEMCIINMFSLPFKEWNDSFNACGI